ncbi:hypothetical protein Tco_0456016 [Tanacetum coccineum]
MLSLNEDGNPSRANIKQALDKYGDSVGYTSDDLILILESFCPRRFRILNAQAEARKEENYGTGDLCGMIKKLEPRADGTLCLRNRSWEIRLKMNLPDHRSIFTDPEDQVMVEMEIPRSSGVNSQPHAHA